MHYLSILAVEASTKEEAISNVADFLDPYQDHAYDWYVVGGRWSGVCGGNDLVCAGENRRVFDEVMERARRAMDREFNRMRQKLVGPDPRISGADVFGEIDENGSEGEAIANRMWEAYKESSRQFSEMVRSVKTPTGGEYTMLGYTLEQLGRYLMGRFDAHSYFYDTVAHSNHPEYLIERVVSNPEKQWLVAVDLHN